MTGVSEVEVMIESAARGMLEWYNRWATKIAPRS